MPVEVKVPSVGESITEVQVGQWRKSEGDAVRQDETLIELESDKATFDVPAPASGVISRILKQPGTTAAVGEVIAYIDESGAPSKKAAPDERQGGATQPAEQRTAPAAARQPAAAESESRVMPAASRALAQHGLKAEQVEATGPGGRLLKEDVQRHAERPKQGTELRPTAPTRVSQGSREDEVVPMSPIRRRIAERLVEAQQNAALLTTFNEIDMSAIVELRQKYRDIYQERHGVKLGFMSFFVKAVVDALKLFPQINAEIRGNEIVYHHYYDIGIDVGGGKGLVVPILRNAERMSFAEIEITITDLAKRARDNKLSVEELQGGTFTISNGGVYGSLLSTPIVNPPQSGVLGMHAIEDRPVVRNGAVVVRPMMYVALTYDHRIVDGREAVSFLKRIKDVVEDPVRLLVEA